MTTTLVVTRGIPGSGKTHWAREWVAEDPIGRARVNRDDYRMMLHNSDGLSPNETAITVARDGAIASLLRQNISVVCDDTNLRAKYVRDLRRIATAAKVEFEVVDLTNVPLALCLQRNAKRDRVVPHEVVVDFYERYVYNQPYPLPLPEEENPGPLEPYMPPVGRPPAILVDIDGTIALRGTRSPFDESRVHEDLPNTRVIEAVRMYWMSGAEVVFVSGRTEGCRGATADWIDEHLRLYNEYELFMRPVGDFRKDWKVKSEIFDKFIRHQYNVLTVFDDRDQVVEMWRSLGLIVFQVAEGNF